MIQYTNKLPSKVDYFELIRTVYEDIDVSELSSELDSTIACICVYNGDRLVGMGRVKKEGDYLCIEDLIVKLEQYREEIQNNIIIALFDQINEMKKYDITVRDCLSMKKSNEEILFKNQNLSQEKVQEIDMGLDSQLDLNGFVGV
ncbi:MAG: hypothetical protein J6J36_01195 [Clostridia bacterium]|nr:hypothetical protein [Clostridia bacterium]